MALIVFFLIVAVVTLAAAVACLFDANTTLSGQHELLVGLTRDLTKRVDALEAEMAGLDSRDDAELAADLFRAAVAAMSAPACAAADPLPFVPALRTDEAPLSCTVTE